MTSPGHARLKRGTYIFVFVKCALLINYMGKIALLLLYLIYVRDQITNC